MYDSDIEVGSKDAAMWKAEAARLQKELDEGGTFWETLARERTQELADARAELAALKQPVSQEVDHLAEAKIGMADGAPVESVIAFALIAIAEELKSLRISAEEMVGR